ncbi:unnamed protein product [Clavelina lepadiformis]|uniref:pyridoxal 5'-phosphate synthase n=1 Tax=Clavelina lepadiformis TaxID=159417 RepID=A0ABP0GCR5_CLALP
MGNDSSKKVAELPNASKKDEHSVVDHDVESLLEANTLKEFYAGNPVGLFQEWYKDAFKHKVVEPFLMSLATCGQGSKPSVRVVSLGDVNEKGFVFGTNVKTRKVREIEENSHVAASFYWTKLSRTVRVEGQVEEFEDNGKTFHAWPRNIQIEEHSALDPDTPLEGTREALIDEMQSLMEKFADVDVIPQPDTIKVYVIIPEVIEFCQAYENLPHIRVTFARDSPESEWRYTFQNR